MDEDKIKQILDKLLIASKEMKIDWNVNKKNPSTFFAQVGNNTITLINSSGAIYFIIANEDNHEVGRVTMSDSKIYQKVENLYEIAKRRALKIDESLDDLDNILGDIIK